MDREELSEIGSRVECELVVNMIFRNCTIQHFIISLAPDVWPYVVKRQSIILLLYNMSRSKDSNLLFLTTASTKFKFNATLDLAIMEAGYKGSGYLSSGIL